MLIVVVHLLLLVVLWRERVATTRNAGVVMAVRMLSAPRESLVMPPTQARTAPYSATAASRRQARSTSTTKATNHPDVLPSDANRWPISTPEADTPAAPPPLRLPQLSDLARYPRTASLPERDLRELAVTKGRLREEELGDGHRRIFLDGRCWDTYTSRASQLDPASMTGVARDLRQVRPCP